MIACCRAIRIAADLRDRCDQADRVGHPPLLIAAVTSMPSTRTYWTAGSVLISMLRSRAVLGHRVGVGQVDVVLEHPPGDRPVHRPGVQVAQAERGRGAAGRGRLARSGRAVDGDDQGPSGRSARSVLAGGLPPNLSRWRCYRPASRGQRGRQLFGGLRADGQLGNADRQAGRVLDPDILDVDAGRSGRGEQPGQLAGLVSRSRPGRPRRRAPGRPACRESWRRRRGRSPAARSAAWRASSPPARASASASAAALS